MSKNIFVRAVLVSFAFFSFWFISTLTIYYSGNDIGSAYWMQGWKGFAIVIPFVVLLDCFLKEAKWFRNRPKATLSFSCLFAMVLYIPVLKVILDMKI